LSVKYLILICIKHLCHALFQHSLIAINIPQSARIVNVKPKINQSLTM
jgi:hypothetical protein